MDDDYSHRQNDCRVFKTCATKIELDYREKFFIAALEDVEVSYGQNSFAGTSRKNWSNFKRSAEISRISQD